MGGFLRRNMNSVAEKERFILLDVVKLFAFYAIVCYHFFDEFWYSRDAVFFHALEASRGVQVARFFCINFQSAGFVLAFICLFLVGYRRYSPDRKKKTAWYLFLIYLLYNLIMILDGDEIVIWDFIPLLIATFLFSAFLEKWTSRFWMWQVALGAMVVFPFWTLQDPGQPLWVQALIGSCDGRITSWSVLPWFGFTCMAMGVGHGASVFRQALTRPMKYEWIVWIPIVPAFCKAFLIYNENQFTSDWECAAFHQPTWVFLSLLIGTMWICRVSMLQATNRALRKLGLHVLGRLKLCQQTGVSYLIHFFPIAILSAFISDETLRVPMVSVYIVLFTFFFPEIALRIVANRDKIF